MIKTARSNKESRDNNTMLQALRSPLKMMLGIFGSKDVRDLDAEVIVTVPDARDDWGVLADGDGDDRWFWRYSRHLGWVD
jgi:hypothetical protein